MKVLLGKVISNKMKNTLVVEVERLQPHPMYNKRMYRTTKYHVHSDKPIEVGTAVKFVMTKPISKTKFHKIWSS